jgi:hypothetical protein
MAVVAAACGDGSTTADGGDAVDVAAESATSSDPSTSDSGTEQGEPGSEGGDGSEDGAAGSLFPDTQVVEIATGAELNLSAELGGGDLPVLLWFWAPH